MSLLRSAAEKKLFLEFAKQVHASLKSKIVRHPMRLRRKAISVYTTSSDGWRCEIGSLGRGVCLELRWDRFNGLSGRYLWFGVYSKKEEDIKKVARIAQDAGDKVPSICPVVIKRNGFRRMQRAISKNMIGVDFAEFYPSNRFPFFYGQYAAHCSTARQLQTDRIVEAASKFYTDLRECLALKGGAPSPKLEVRRKKHFIVEKTKRCQALAAACKKRDGYRCAICKMTFESVYGSIGYQFAECHHIVPLSKLDRATYTTLDSLITVCANCHRMLHRMNGERKDIRRLRAALRQHK